ncbi:MAG: hypothetical protein ACQESJ_09235 [Bacteroidota bacterium]
MDKKIENGGTGHSLYDKQSFSSMNNPFPGLRPFRKNESHLFFGRKNQVNEVLEKLSFNRFVGIVGKSGIGKSSFVNCGILPKLEENDNLTKVSWDIIGFRPGADPLQKMEKVFAETLQDKKLIKEDTFKTFTFNSPEHLCEIGQKYYDATGKNLLIYIDQFEEIFRFSEEGESRQIEQFIDLIINTINSPETPISFIITIRSDFVGDCSQFPEFTKAINNSQFLIPQMTREEKREAISGPVKVKGANIEEDLVEKILQDINDRHDQLPLMQHALMRTWDYWQTIQHGDTKITLSCYKNIGGMEKALSVHANEIFNELEEDKKKICERLFKSITEKGAEGRSIRRPASIREISRIADAGIDDVKEIVEHFRKPGRTILTPSEDVELTEDTIVDISHESLMRIWEVLAEWLEEEHEAIKEYLHISEAAEMHQLGKGGLLKSPELQIALNWKEENKPTKEWGIRHDNRYDRAMQFLAFSEKKFLQEQRLKEKLQKLRLVVFKSIALVFGIGAIIALAFFFYAQKQREEAVKQQGVANEQKIIANEQAEKAQKSAEEALKQKQNAEKQKQKALYSQKLANEQKQEALEQRKLAENEREFAMEQKDKATMSRQKAEKLRLLSIARSMAVKSIKESDRIIKSLSARQAYNLHKDNGGREMDTDIYNALYYAVKMLKGDDYNEAGAHSDNVRDIVAAEDSESLFSAGSDGQVFLWQRTKENFVPKLIDQEKGKVHQSIALSEDNKTLLVVGKYPYMKLINLEDLSERKIDIQTSNLQYASFTPDGEKVVYMADNKRIMEWDFNKTREILASETKINSIDMNPQGQYLAVGKEGGEVVLVDMMNGVELDLFESKNKGDITALEYSEDGNMLAVGDMFGVVRMISSYSGELHYTLSGHHAMINNIAFSHSGDRLATASFDHSVRIWSLDNPFGQPVILKDHDDWVWSVEFDQSDRYLLAGCRDKLIRSWLLDIDEMASMICEDEKVNRNFTETEWNNYVAEDVEYECTCAENNQKSEQKDDNQQLAKKQQ